MKLNLLKKLKNWIEYFNEYRNPLMPYWKVRKIFKRPKCHFMYGTKIWFFGLILRQHLNRIFSFRTSALGWKWKYEYVRHEWDPYIVFTLFRKWQIMWIFNYVVKGNEDSSAINIGTWEAMLDMLYNDKSLNYVFKAQQWKASDGRIIDIKNNLTWDGYFEVLKNDKNSSDK